MNDIEKANLIKEAHSLLNDLEAQIASLITAAKGSLKDAA